MINDRIEIIEGDITRLSVDAIVNAANTTLLGGGGVDGAIHRAAGKELLEECKTLGGCKTGQAKITRGYNLPAKWVIHTVGPVWNGGERGEAQLLRSCYLESLKIAKERRFNSIAFPSISTGAYRYPRDEAANIAISTVIEFLKQNEFPVKVIFVSFDEENTEIYRRILAKTLTSNVD